MSTLEKATKWKMKDDGTLTFSYSHKGKLREESLEQKGHHLIRAQLDRLSLFDETKWGFEDKRIPGSTTGYSSHETIRTVAVLDRCRIHCVHLDGNESEVFSRLKVDIYSTSLEKLQATARNRFSSQPLGVPREPMKDGLGEIVYHPDMFYVSLFLDQASFDALAKEIKAGGVRSARIAILANLFKEMSFGYPLDDNYAMLCENDEKSGRSVTEAQLYELHLEWSPRLEAKTVFLRESPEHSEKSDEIESIKRNTYLQEREVENAANRASEIIQAIRSNTETLYYIAVILIFLFVLSRVLSWFGI